MKEKISIKLHAARSSGGRVIWAEVSTKESLICDLDALQKHFGKKATLTWELICNGIRTKLSNDDSRIEQGGFLLRIPEKEARTGVRAECTLSA